MTHQDMTVLSLAMLAVLVFGPVLLAILYAVGVQGDRGGLWRALYLFGVTGWPLDIILNHTTFLVIMGSVPRWYEFTFSQHLSRLVFERSPIGDKARTIARWLNDVAPHHDHIYIPTL